MYAILHMLSLFQNHKLYPIIRMSNYAIKYFNEFYTGGRELESRFITKVLEGIKRPSGYTENPKIPLSSSDLEGARQCLGSVEMNLTELRLMMILILSFVGFFRFNELSILNRSDFISGSISDFISYWLHLDKLNSNLCPLDLTKRYFVLARIYNQCEKYIFRVIKITKNGQKQRKIDNPISYRLSEVTFSSF